MIEWRAAFARWNDRDSGSGPRLAALYHRALCGVVFVAFASLAWQVDVLLGEHGLLPARAFLAQYRAAGLGATSLPSVFLWLPATDRSLAALAWLGAALALAGLVSGRGRLVYVFAIPVYLSYVSVGRTFFSFQWDNLLLESMLLGLCLPRDRRARWAHLLFRLLLWKLYFESGIAKWQSHLHDWHDGSAMMFYYETAPLPAPMAYWLHALPMWWHRLEAWGVLALELVVPFFVFGPRRLRRLALVSLTGFQLVNFSSGNYGFFIPLALALHLFLLDDADLARCLRLPALQRAWRGEPFIAGSVLTIYVALSTGDALASFADRAPTGLERDVAVLRLVNTYHLFGHITRERIEPEVEVLVDGAWQPLDFRWKPGAVARALPYVAPHQPRVDFQLWFFGLGYRRGTPAWASALLARVCDSPATMQALFATPLPEPIAATRFSFWQYHFTAPSQRRATGEIWRREKRGELAATSCAP